MIVKVNYIKSILEDVKLREALAEIVANVDALIPQSEEEFMELQKFGLYPAEKCSVNCSRNYATMAVNSTTNCQKICTCLGNL